MKPKPRKIQKPPKRRSKRSKNRIKKLRLNLTKLLLSIKPKSKKPPKNLKPNQLTRPLSKMTALLNKKILKIKWKLKRRDIKKPCKKPLKIVKTRKLSNSATWPRKLLAP